MKYKKKIKLCMSILTPFLVLSCSDSGPVEEKADVLFVALSEELQPGDQKLETRIRELGYTTRIVGENFADTNLDSVKYIFISESVGSDTIEDFFKDVEKPVMTTEAYIMDDMLMVETEEDIAKDNLEAITGTGVEASAGLSKLAQWRITDATHPIVNSYAGKIVNMWEPNSEMFQYGGQPVAGAKVLAEYSHSNGNTYSPLFVYDQGETMGQEFVAPNKRTAFTFFLGNVPEFTPDAWALFDATIRWTFSD